MHERGLCWTWFVFIHNNSSKLKSTRVKSCCESVLLPTAADTLLRKAFFCHLHQPLFKNCWIIPGSFYRLDQQLNPGTLPKFPMTPETQKVVFIFQRAKTQAQGYISYQISRNCTGSTFFEFSCAKLASRPGKSEYCSAGGGFTLFKVRVLKGALFSRSAEPPVSVSAERNHCTFIA